MNALKDLAKAILYLALAVGVLFLIWNIVADMSVVEPGIPTPIPGAAVPEARPTPYQGVIVIPNPDNQTVERPLERIEAKADGYDPERPAFGRTALDAGNKSPGRTAAPTPDRSAADGNREGGRR